MRKYGANAILGNRPLTIREGKRMNAAEQVVTAVYAVEQAQDLTKIPERMLKTYQEVQRLAEAD